METNENKGTQFKNSDVEPIFGLAKIDEKIKIVLGNNIVTSKEFESFEEAEKYIESKPYELIINTAILISKFTQTESKKIVKPKKQKELCKQ